MIPTWTYLKDADGLYVNLFIGSRIHVERVAGTDVEMVQQTDYPWNGTVAITVNPQVPRRFSIHVRVPDRQTSRLYDPTPKVRGLKSLTVNGKSITPKMLNGYAVVTRQWKAGDRIELDLPLEPQRIKADPKIAANRGRVALRYGPLLYNVERADQADLEQRLGAAPLTAEWCGDLLQGVMVLKGEWANGKPMRAIPNYARMNRAGQVGTAEGGNAGEPAINYAPGAWVSGATAGARATSAELPSARPRNHPVGPQSLVWMKDE
jgi:hypothetical protein